MFPFAAMSRKIDQQKLAQMAKGSKAATPTAKGMGISEKCLGEEVSNILTSK